MTASAEELAAEPVDVNLAPCCVVCHHFAASQLREISPSLIYRPPVFALFTSKIWIECGGSLKTSRRSLIAGSGCF
jgi:hypothetical protein